MSEWIEKRQTSSIVFFCNDFFVADVGAFLRPVVRIEADFVNNGGGDNDSSSVFDFVSSYNKIQMTIVKW